MLHVASVCTSCYMLLRVVGSWIVAQSLKPVKLLGQQLSIVLLFPGRRSVAQQCWIRLHSSSNIAGTTHAHYTWSPKSYWLVVGVVASVCTLRPTRTQQLPTLLARPFTRSLSVYRHSLVGQSNSSDLSPQSATPSQRLCCNRHEPSAHWNWWDAHVTRTVGHPTSSEPSEQSCSPSHLQLSGWHALKM